MTENHKPIHLHSYRVQQQEKLIKNNSDFSQDPNAIPIRSCRQIAAQAIREGKWLYDPKSREWYSPEEFIKAFDAIKSGIEPILARVQIKHPSEGIEAGYKVIVKMQEKWNGLVQRVLLWRAGDNDPETPRRA